MISNIDWIGFAHKAVQFLMLVAVTAVAAGLIKEPASSWIFVICSAVQMVFGISAYSIVPKKKE